MRRFRVGSGTAFGARCWSATAGAAGHVAGLGGWKLTMCGRCIEAVRRSTSITSRRSVADPAIETRLSPKPRRADRLPGRGRQPGIVS